MAKTSAKTSDDEKKRKSSAGATAATWMMTGFLVIGLGGFGVTSFSNTVNSIGAVGDTKIAVRDYQQAVRNEVNQISQQQQRMIGAQEALRAGAGERAVAATFRQAALDEAARRAGLSVGDQAVLADLVGQNIFVGPSGQFDPAIYREMLVRSGMNQTDYEADIRRGLARRMLTDTVAAGFSAPPAMADTLLTHFTEERGFSMLRLSESDLDTALPQPSDADLRVYYDSHIADFTKPAAKRLRYAALLPADLAASQPVDEAAVAKLYQDNIAEYVVPERRLVDRLVYPDAAARDAALTSGKGFEALATDRGVPMANVDMGDVSLAQLGAAGAAVFAAEPGALIAGETDLGPAIFRVNGVLTSENRSLDDVRDELSAGFQDDAARRVIAERVEEIDDLLAGGSGIEDLAKDLGMKLVTLDFVADRQSEDKIEGYEAFRTAARALRAGEFPEAILLDDGGVVALEYVEEVPAAPIPFDEARASVEAAWHGNALREALSARAIALKAAAEGGTSLGALGIVDVSRKLNRQDRVPGAPAGLIKAVFEMSEGEMRVFEEGDFIAVLRLDSAAAPADSPETTMLRNMVEQSISVDIGSDALQAFTQAVMAETGFSLDQTALNLVNTSLQ